MIKNIGQLLKATDENEVIGFGKYKGRKLSQIPKDYIDWAKKTDSKTKTPSDLYELYLSCIESATGVAVPMPWKSLSEKEKNVWILFKRRL